MRFFYGFKNGLFELVFAPFTIILCMFPESDRLMVKITRGKYDLKRL